MERGSFITYSRYEGASLFDLYINITFKKRIQHIPKNKTPGCLLTYEIVPHILPIWSVLRSHVRIGK